MAIARPEPPSRHAGPLTRRGHRTRTALVNAARELLERNGYADTRIVDITRHAKVSYGSFYTYFASKEAIFTEIVDRMIADFHAVVSAEPVEGRTPRDLIARTNRGYLRAYRQNAAMMALLEQVASSNPELRTLRRDARRSWIKKSSAAIAHWQRDGLASAEIDPYYAASALGSMVDRSAYVWMVLGEPFDEELAVEQLTTLYCNAIGLDARAPAPFGTAPS